MNDYIDREAAIKAMLTRFWDGKETLREIMQSVPAADVAASQAREVGTAGLGL